MKEWTLYPTALLILGCTVGGHRPAENIADNPSPFVSGGGQPLPPTGFRLDKECSLTLPTYDERKNGSPTHWLSPAFASTEARLDTDLFATRLCHRAVLVLPSQKTDLPNHPQYLIAAQEALPQDGQPLRPGLLEIQFFPDAMPRPLIGHSYKLQYWPASPTIRIPAENRSGLFVELRPSLLMASAASATYALDYQKSSVTFRHLPQADGDDLTVDIQLQVNEFQGNQDKPSHIHGVKGRLSAKAYALRRWEGTTP